MQVCVGWLCQKKTGRLDYWKSGLLCGNIGDSVERLQFKTIAPCVLPTQKYLWLVYGKLELKSQPSVYLGLQGFGPKEQRHFNLQDLPLGKAQDLAGNAFAANVCCAVLLAILSHVDQLT
jgi:hypothetical protein